MVDRLPPTPKHSYGVHSRLESTTLAANTATVAIGFARPAVIADAGAGELIICGGLSITDRLTFTPEEPTPFRKGLEEGRAARTTCLQDHSKSSPLDEAVIRPPIQKVVLVLGILVVVLRSNDGQCSALLRHVEEILKALSGMGSGAIAAYAKRADNRQRILPATEEHVGCQLLRRARLHRAERMRPE